MTNTYLYKFKEGFYQGGEPTPVDLYRMTLGQVEIYKFSNDRYHTVNADLSLSVIPDANEEGKGLTMFHSPKEDRDF
jgi:hypothetical protein